MRGLPFPQTEGTNHFSSDDDEAAQSPSNLGCIELRICRRSRIASSKRYNSYKANETVLPDDGPVQEKSKNGDGKGVQPHQTFLRFYDPETGEEGIQPVRVGSGGKAKFELVRSLLSHKFRGLLL